MVTNTILQAEPELPLDTVTQPAAPAAHDFPEDNPGFLELYDQQISVAMVPEEIVADGGVPIAFPDHVPGDGEYADIYGAFPDYTPFDPSSMDAHAEDLGHHVSDSQGDLLPRIFQVLRGPHGAQRGA